MCDCVFRQQLGVEQFPGCTIRCNKERCGGLSVECCVSLPIPPVLYRVRIVLPRMPHVVKLRECLAHRVGSYPVLPESVHAAIPLNTYQILSASCPREMVPHDLCLI
jgi:hypothetical protein